jgi:hypothetical protein
VQQAGAEVAYNAVEAVGEELPPLPQLGVAGSVGVAYGLSVSSGRSRSHRPTSVYIDIDTNTGNTGGHQASNSGQ